MKIRPVGDELLHEDGQTSRRADRRTDMTKLTVVLRNFANAPKNKKKKQGTVLSSCAHTKVSAKISQLFQKLKGEKPKHTQARTLARSHT